MNQIEHFMVCNTFTGNINNFKITLYWSHQYLFMELWKNQGVTTEGTSFSILRILK